MYLGMIIRKSETSHHKKADEYISKGIKILQELKLKPALAKGYLDQGELFLDNNEPKEAIENLKTAESMFQEMGMDF